MKITLLGRARRAFASTCARNAFTSWSECFEDGIEMLNNVGFSSDHLAVTTFKSPHSPAGPHVYVVKFFVFEFLRTSDVVDVIGVSPVDDDVARTCKRTDLGERAINKRR